MKQIAIISGKGGTGKTTIAAAFTELASRKIVADCDVEAPNLHLLLEHRIRQESLFQGNRCAHIDPEQCISCGKCRDVCRYQAVEELGKGEAAVVRSRNGAQNADKESRHLIARATAQADSGVGPLFRVDPKRCEGCAACVYACPAGAVELRLEDTGKIFLSDSSAGEFAHAELFLAADGSGKLVSEVRRLAQQEALGDDKLVIIDGSPGIGCVVISTITGCQAVLIVTEPTQSGKHDLARVLKITQHFHVPALVAINKWDLNPDMTIEIEKLCLADGVEVAGKIPFDTTVPQAIAAAQAITRFDSPASAAIRKLWGRVQEELVV
ncbi:CobQ/CobB/MinD/ParA nucleotide binding domain protein [Acididesulfobacillus acetoxydans]|uniref:CobQ/CobB/MinD/ParA nucleotide binding domain protein n=1 Tax=Acididesulfobacillus acetoxydans TaxID=1561005 RepID=A0A8S0WM81_9FIRM|nr:ATP-binding protein [Acididesulfobacillus acetoxydans]CAA7600444.1 CobQ/CobB/MinD/ParA nucleotide binding domain protein [Acididesulfobacillus acetoxydans]CEJ06578.1 CobQ/CobB/MinD/ParA nucleotide binding domain protein [Acididesulfobacillus acetoxydans]